MILDGENQVDNIVHLATTNYPEKLDPRIVQRPNRFDEVLRVEMPSDKARAAYFDHHVPAGSLSDAEKERWVRDTKAMGVAHLRELVASVQCLGMPYDDVLIRLKGMLPGKRKPSSEDAGIRGVGFHGT